MAHYEYADIEVFRASRRATKFLQPLPTSIITYRLLFFLTPIGCETGVSFGLEGDAEWWFLTQTLSATLGLREQVLA
jgi:hypothetical protein